MVMSSVDPRLWNGAGDGAGLALKSKPLPVPSRGHPVTAPHGRHETADLQAAESAIASGSFDEALACYLRALSANDAASREADDHEFSPGVSPVGGALAAAGAGTTPTSQRGSRSSLGSLVAGSPIGDSLGVSRELISPATLPGFTHPPSPPIGVGGYAASNGNGSSPAPQTHALLARLRGVWEQLVPHYSSRLDVAFGGAADGVSVSGNPAAALLSLHPDHACFWRLTEDILRPHAEKPVQRVTSADGFGRQSSVSLSMSTSVSSIPGSPHARPARIRGYPDSPSYHQTSGADLANPFAVPRYGSRVLWDRPNRVAAMSPHEVSRDWHRDFSEALSTAAGERLMVLETMRRQMSVLRGIGERCPFELVGAIYGARYARVLSNLLSTTSDIPGAHERDCLCRVFLEFSPGSTAAIAARAAAETLGCASDTGWVKAAEEGLRRAVEASQDVLDQMTALGKAVHARVLERLSNQVPSSHHAPRGFKGTGAALGKNASDVEKGRKRGPSRYLAEGSGLLSNGSSRSASETAPSLSALVAPAPEGSHGWPPVVHSRRRTDQASGSGIIIEDDERPRTVLPGAAMALSAAVDYLAVLRLAPQPLAGQMAATVMHCVTTAEKALVQAGFLSPEAALAKSSEGPRRASTSVAVPQSRLVALAAAGTGALAARVCRALSDALLYWPTDPRPVPPRLTTRKSTDRMGDLAGRRRSAEGRRTSADRELPAGSRLSDGPAGLATRQSALEAIAVAARLEVVAGAAEAVAAEAAVTSLEALVCEELRSAAWGSPRGPVTFCPTDHLSALEPGPAAVALRLSLCGLLRDLSRVSSVAVSRRTLSLIVIRALPKICFQFLALSPSLPWVPRFTADVRHVCATLLDLKGALFGRGEAVALSTFLGNLCGAMCTRAALLASPAEDLEAAIEAAQMVYGQGRDGSPAPLLQGSAEIALQSAMSVTADRLHETFLDRMAGRKRDTELAHDSTVRSQLGCSGLGPGWEWLQDDLVEAFGSANVLSLAAETSDAPAFVQDAFEPVRQGDDALYLELRQTLAGIANAEAAASALPRRWELVPCEPGWHTQEEEAQKAHLRDRLAAAGLCKRF